MESAYCSGEYITLRLLLGCHQIYAVLIGLDILIHDLGNFRVFGKQCGRLAQIMTFGHPEEVQEQKMLLPGRQPHSAADHLLIK